MDFKYPYTDYHELNLDWFLSEFKNLVEVWAKTQQDWISMQEYIRDYFDNLNVQTEIDNKINAMILDGTFGAIVEPFVTAALPALVAGQLPDVVAAQISSVVAAQIGAVVAGQLPAIAAQAAADEVGTWLAAHIDPDTGYVIDDTLTVQNAAADAKAAGNAIRALNTVVDSMTDTGSVSYTGGNLSGDVGNQITISTSSNYDYAIVKVVPGVTYAFTYVCRNSKSKYVYCTDPTGVILAVTGEISYPDGTKNTEYVKIPAGCDRVYINSYIHNSEHYFDVKMFFDAIDDHSIITGCSEKTNNILWYTNNLDIVDDDYTIRFEKDNSITIDGNITSYTYITLWGATEYTSNNIFAGTVISCNRFVTGVTDGNCTLRRYSTNSSISGLSNVVFDADDAVFIRINPGTFDNYNVKFIITATTVRSEIYYPPVTAIDYIARADINVLNNSIGDINSQLNVAIFRAGLKNKNRMLFSAHRGAEGQAPYGSYPAYKLACVQGWDMLQIAQARQSADGTWYCLHDSSVDAQTNGTGEIADLTDAYIDTIYQDDGVNVASYTHDELKLPTLESILQLAYRYGVRVSIRMGSLPGDVNTPEHLASWTSFIDLVSNFSPENMMFSGSYTQVSILKQLTDNWHGNIYITTDTVQSMVDTCVGAGYTNISIMASTNYITEDLIKYIHSKGYYYISSQMAEPTNEKFIQLSDYGADIAQTGVSSIHSLDLT